MGIFKKVGRAIKGAAKTVGKYSGIKSAENLIHGIGGQGGDDSARSDAASQMVRKNVTRQAGSGAINFNTEEQA